MTVFDINTFRTEHHRPHRNILMWLASEIVLWNKAFAEYQSLNSLDGYAMRDMGIDEVPNFPKSYIEQLTK